jgi:methylated-DNA-[protein]-cysteine S-methyltransferase
MGTLALVAGEEGLEQIRFEGTPPAGAIPCADHPILMETRRQLDAYFERELRDFDIPLVLKGTPFQILVWRALQQIPYGVTRSYAQQARAIGAPDAVRAVGSANGRNPIPIVVPCHRVIGSNGKLTGFGGGLPLKRYLLDLETNPRLPLI